jgi:hypothetical protein
MLQRHPGLPHGNDDPCIRPRMCFSDRDRISVDHDDGRVAQ